LRGTSDSLALEAGEPENQGMKRLIAGPLWFASFALMYELLWSLTGVPRVIGPVIGLMICATVWIDPMHWFWPAASSRPTTSTASRLLQTSAK
jgi:hypothetical protein